MKDSVLRLIIAFLFLLIGIQFASAQGKVIGSVFDTDETTPLQFAAVSIYSQSDTAMITGGTTDLDGNFEIPVSFGKYMIKVDFISYRSIWSDGFEVSAANSTVDMGMVTLSTDATVLQEIEVRAEKSTLQMAMDKKVFNVGKDLASTSGSASEVLDNIPSVTVDVEGNVSLRGSEGVRILVDGKPSGLVGVRGANGLQSLGADMIEKVEVITNPSARYEAEGMTGIINIILKKERKEGLNGSFDLRAGAPANYGAGINLNYRKKKINFFTNYGFRYRRGPGISNQYQEFVQDGQTNIVEVLGDRNRGGYSNSVRMGADYFLNDRNTLTASFNYRNGRDNNESRIEYYDYLNSYPDNLTGITVRTQDELEKEPNLEYALNYKRTFKKDGQELLASVQYRQSTESEDADYRETFFESDFSPLTTPDLLQRSYNEEGEKSLLLQTDYIQPIGREGKLEFGYRGSFRQIDNDYLVEEFADDVWGTLPNLSNDFNYDENIHAIYAILGNKPGRFSYQFGLRMEVSDVLTELLQTGERNDRTYTNFFPSAHFTYELSEGNNVQISYSRRLRRPRFWDLNPFFTFSDARNIFRGNPNLNPEFTDVYEIGHIKYFNNASLSSNIYYRHTNGLIQRIQTLQQEENGDLITVRQPENLATEDAIGLEFIFSADPAKWLRMDASVNAFHSSVDGSNLNQSYVRDAFSWFGRINSRMTIWKKLDVQLRLNYRAPQQTAQGDRKSMSYVDLALSREVLRGKGTLTLSLNDAFNSQKYRYSNYGENFFSEGIHQRRPRSVSLNFSYRLNQSQRKRGDREGGRDGQDFDGGDGQF
ncbi:outer membrane beta-barrel family protein [Flavilitoribacter nigricans]|uniref:TonB-dependent receptor n=1 Tax=Flavilitoribacter nigricans (strain ATCC 23147 / DSM 23189 / NBRC 102662 / NCIMB 1420 / SS-2) TaxID=1122177 RepID=A0A2D0NC06_FLAN2|nr:outer membrane beta-barrel family protein [Flavilitoribacter nigricans]PHN05908.1 TonB-dependent receptor [Flavilitoribacter nigricans DSM 23189 = NBRC 102662]